MHSKKESFVFVPIFGNNIAMDIDSFGVKLGLQIIVWVWLKTYSESYEMITILNSIKTYWLTRIVFISCMIYMNNSKKLYINVWQIQRLEF